MAAEAWPERIPALPETGRQQGGEGKVGDQEELRLSAFRRRLARFGLLEGTRPTPTGGNTDGE